MQQRLEAAEEVFLPVIVLGELYFGAEKSGRRAENVARVEEFAGARSVLGCDAQVAREYGAIKYRLQQKRRPLPENDIWVAALARRYGLVLATRDQHFREVETLTIEAW